MDFWNNNESQNQVSKAKVVLTNNPLFLKFKYYKRRLPPLLYSKIAPYLGRQHVKNS